MRCLCSSFAFLQFLILLPRSLFLFGLIIILFIWFQAKPPLDLCPVALFSHPSTAADQPWGHYFACLQLWVMRTNWKHQFGILGSETSPQVVNSLSFYVWKRSLFSLKVGLTSAIYILSSWCFHNVIFGIWRSDFTFAGFNSNAAAEFSCRDTF